MPAMEWLKKYDITLYSQVISVMGNHSPPHYNTVHLSMLNDLGVSGFYFNYIDAGNDNAPDWLPKHHRLATMVVQGTTTRAVTNITQGIYEAALDSTPIQGKMHTILYFKDNHVEVQSLLSLGNLNRHSAMGTQVIVGSPTASLAKTIIDFIMRFAGRDDIIQLDEGTWEDGLNTIHQHIQQLSPSNI